MSVRVIFLWKNCIENQNFKLKQFSIQNSFRISLELTFSVKEILFIKKGKFLADGIANDLFFLR